MTGAEGMADLHKRALAITCIIIIISQRKVEGGGRELFKSLFQTCRQTAWRWQLEMLNGT